MKRKPTGISWRLSIKDMLLQVLWNRLSPRKKIWVASIFWAVIGAIAMLFGIVVSTPK